MATDVREERAAHIRGVTVTALASLAGVLAGIVSQALTSGPADPLGVVVLALLVALQFPILKVTGAVDEFSTRDQLFIGFMTFSLWFVTWGILLTTDAQLPF